MTLAILLYHGVDDTGSALSVPRDAFARQMAAVARSGRRVVTMDEAARAIAAGGEPDGVAITFDDALLSVAEIAWPILRDLGLRATTYVASGFVGDRARWLDAGAGDVAPDAGLASLGRRIGLADPSAAMAAAAGLPIMTWDDLRALREDGMDIGGHSVSHRRLSSLPHDACRREIAADRDAIADAVGASPATFAYPFGDVDAETARLVGEAGYLCAVSTVPGHCPRVDIDRFRLPRIGVAAGVTAPRMAYYLSPLYRLRQGIRRSPAPFRASQPVHAGASHG